MTASSGPGDLRSLETGRVLPTVPSHSRLSAQAISSWRLSSLPELSAGLWSLAVDDNQLTSLPIPLQQRLKPRPSRQTSLVLALVHYSSTYCAFLLSAYASHSGSLIRVAFLSARNDAIANVAIITAGLLTAYFWHSAWFRWRGDCAHVC